MTTYYAKAAGSILASNAWNTAANGSGTDATFADGNAAGHTLDLNGLAMTSPTGTTLTCTILQASSNGSSLTPTGTLTINGNVTFSYSASTGMIVAGTGVSVTINGQVTSTSSGYAIVSSSDATVTVSNSGSTALSMTGSSGRCLSHGSTGSITITGAITQTNSGAALRIGAAATVSITGNVSSSSSAAVVVIAGTTTIAGDVSATGTGVGFTASNGTVILHGTASTTGSAIAFQVTGSSGVASWTGDRAIAANTECRIVITAGTINFGTSTESLTLSVSGCMYVDRQGGGTVSQTYGVLRLQTTAAQICGMGAASPPLLTVTGPALPVVGDVKSGTTFGYAGDVKTGTYTGGGGIFVIEED